MFREELNSAEKWIQDTQASIQEQIDRLEDSYEKVRTILDDTKAFKAE